MPGLPELLAFLKALPALYGFWQVLQKQFGDSAPKVLERTQAAFNQLDKAATEKEYFDSAKSIQDLIRKL